MQARSLAWLPGRRGGRPGRGTLMMGLVSNTESTCCYSNNPPLHVPKDKILPTLLPGPSRQVFEGVPEMSQSKCILDPGLQPKFLDFQCSMFSWHGFPNLAVHPNLPEQLLVIQVPGPHYRLRNQNFCIFNKLPRKKQPVCEPAFRNPSPKSACFR